MLRFVEYSHQLLVRCDFFDFFLEIGVIRVTHPNNYHLHMNDSKFCLVRLKTEGNAKAAAGDRGPMRHVPQRLTSYEQSIQRLRLPFSKEEDIERAVMKKELRLELQRYLFHLFHLS